MDTPHWPQDQGVGVVRPIENPIKPIEKKPRPEREQPLNCPRCNSTNTKFCYYNNYSLSQPRYFCKTCRRYWTQGGTLRNVPIGGGSRKNKKSLFSSSKKVVPQKFSPQNPKISEGRHLNLAYNPLILNGISQFSSNLVPQNPNFQASSNFPNLDYNSYGFGGGDEFIKPSLSFSLDGLGNLQNVEDHHTSSSLSRSVFAFEELKPRRDHQLEMQGRGQGELNNGYWNVGGSW
ncbi:hypothetical protein CDL12_05882 [Handroanthus impetiginosus]|uniref:Dof zinc finger protein n=1 Tax=Handroanthus impetiginosus TaxID=429701 RepID=A0A2G9HV63_9LAMI|nr:hypothetical protein CDL12_05882 [Handroanthus impetiginosus]